MTEQQTKYNDMTTLQIASPYQFRNEKTGEKLKNTVKLDGELFVIRQAPNDPDRHYFGRIYLDQLSKNGQKAPEYLEVKKGDTHKIAVMKKGKIVLIPFTF